MLLWNLWEWFGLWNYSNVCQCLFWCLIVPEILRHNDALNFPQTPRQWNDYPEAWSQLKSLLLQHWNNA